MKTLNFQIITKDYTLEEKDKYLKDIAVIAVKSLADVLQLRNKKISDGDIYRSALFLKKTLDGFKEKKGDKPLLIINDRPDIAHIVGADGVHLGQDDIPAECVKKTFPDLIIGVSADKVEEALKAEKDGASYIGVGPVYATSSKKDAGGEIDRNTIKQITDSVNIPVIAIGGINEFNIEVLSRYKVRGAAVIGAISNAEEPLKSALELRKKIVQYLIKR